MYECNEEYFNIGIDSYSLRNGSVYTIVQSLHNGYMGLIHVILKLIESSKHNSEAMAKNIEGVLIEYTFCISNLVSHS